jgi:hypothetical protein
LWQLIDNVCEVQHSVPKLARAICGCFEKPRRHFDWCAPGAARRLATRLKHTAHRDHKRPRLFGKVYDGSVKIIVALGR